MREVTKENFEKEVILSDKPVMVDFWGPRCGPCLALMPEVKALEQEYGDMIKIVKVEAPKNRKLCLSLRVLGLPTYLFYGNGEEIDRLSGKVTIQEVDEAIKKALAKAGGN